MRTIIAVALLATFLVGCHKTPANKKESRQMRICTEISSDERIPMSERVAVAKRKLREEFKNAGLGRIADDLTKLTKVSIRLKATTAVEGDLKWGGSKLGGTADLPKGVAWPLCNGVPMALLAQLRLKDVAPFDADGQLPKSGMLYFFYDAVDQKWGFDPKDRDHWRVIYYDGDPAAVEATIPPATLPEENRLRLCKITLASEITVPSWESDEIRRLALSDQESQKYTGFPGADCGEGEVLHRLLGHPEQIQGNMQLECQLTSNGIYTGDASGYHDPRRATLEKGADDWQLLLQIDSDEENLGVMWGDVGRVYFWIRKQDLKERNFSGVWLVLQCY